MPHQYFHIVYPTDQVVRDDTIERWFMEARAANEIALDYCGARTPADMLEALADMGFVRLGE
jgi:hypothetical protein